MHETLESLVEDADVLIMAAAVADFRPRQASTTKIKKRVGRETLDLELVRNPDILQSIATPGLVKVGFAAETDDLVASARAKLESKGLHMIVANDAVATIGSTHSQAMLLFRDRPPVELPELPKDDLASRIIADVARLVGERGTHA